MTINRLELCKIMDLPKMLDPRGNLTFIEQSKHIPFDIKRIFYIYDVPTGESRGAHAHHNLHQFMICVSGSFNVELDDGFNKKTVHLNRPWQGLYVPPLVWSAATNFDPGSVCVVLVSELYDEGDYIRDYKKFLKIVSEG